MELTLSLQPADAARLRRLPIVKAARSGRSRGNAVRIVWHDSLDRTLASRGLSLAEQRGAWRLERYRPAPSVPWPPATDHQVIQAADALETLRDALLRAGGREAEVLPDAITPVAAFEGRQTMFALIVDGEAVSMTLLEGVLRAVAAEQPATRLSLAGPGFHVRAVMRTLVETLPLAVPEKSLAAEALRLADGTQAVSRRHGAPVLPPNGALGGPPGSMSVHGAFAHITGHLTDVILNLAPLAADPDSGPEPVHQMRVAVRRARSAFSIFPPVADDPAAVRGAAGLRRLGQMLGPARDWDVFMTETAPPAETALPGQPALRPLLRAAARRRRAARMALIEFLTGPAFRSLTLDLACVAAADAPTFGLPAVCPASSGLASSGPASSGLASSGPASSGPASIGPPSISLTETTTPLREFAAGVLQKRWRKLLHAGKALDDLDSPGLHRLRLKAKRLRYAAEFFAPMFPGKPTSRFIRRLAALQERLGLFNDTTVAEALLRDLGAKPSFAAGLVLGFTAAQGARARPKIAAAWTRFRHREPFWT